MLIWTRAPGLSRGKTRAAPLLPPVARLRLQYSKTHPTPSIFFHLGSCFFLFLFRFLLTSEMVLEIKFWSVTRRESNRLLDLLSFYRSSRFLCFFPSNRRRRHGRSQRQSLYFFLNTNFDGCPRRPRLDRLSRRYRIMNTDRRGRPAFTNTSFNVEVKCLYDESLSHAFESKVVLPTPTSSTSGR
jgi:hypothetical protein